MYECLGFGGEKDDILLKNCLLLVRYYIYCYKFKNIAPCIGEHVQRLKFNFEIEIKSKFLLWQVQRTNFSRDGAKFSMHYN